MKKNINKSESYNFEDQFSDVILTRSGQKYSKRELLSSASVKVQSYRRKPNGEVVVFNGTKKPSKKDPKLP